MTEKLFDLDEEERALIYAHRQQKEQAREQRMLRLRVLELALRYETWLQKQGRGSSFSTFVNEFGYDDPGGKHLYTLVQAVRDALSDLQACGLDRPAPN
ncbi:hypothetical protein [Pseudomonas paralcaligenes]|uniref:hypothetical protein n=1 Tax=Pseudomonas paralcaligenes TaxID=2772558 RepID=UPI001C7EE01E|nr:hypothetical protein [Pseudomonas paralcaligenes]